MADKSHIEWTEATWNPIVGCSVLSPGCKRCYAMRMAARLERMGTAPHYAGTTMPAKAGPVWTGKMALAPERILTQPLRWKNPRTIFVNSMGDLFHEAVPDRWIDRVFAVMALTPQHTYQALTKRAKRMREYLSDPDTPRRIYELVCDLVTLDGVRAVLLAPGFADPGLMPSWPRLHLGQWPLPNVWLGVSTEDQARADERVPELLATPAAIRFVSAEPLLGAIDFLEADPYAFGKMKVWLPERRPGAPKPDIGFSDDTTIGGAIAALGGRIEHRRGLDWVIVGGESGPGARPMHPDWARWIRDDCAAGGVPFFFKQWGEWAPGECADFLPTRTERTATWFAQTWDYGSLTPTASEEMHHDDAPDLYWIGKRRAGRLLDGVEHNGMPEPREVPSL